MSKNQYLNLDTGACYTKKQKEGFGFLSAFDMTNRLFYTQKNIDVGNVYWKRGVEGFYFVLYPIKLQLLKVL